MSKIADCYVEIQAKGMSAFESAMSRVSSTMARIGQAAADLAGRFGRAMKGLADSVGSGFVNRWNQFISMMQNAQAFTAKLATTFAAAGLRAGKALADGLAGRIGAASASIGQKLAAIASGFTLGNLDVAVARLLFRFNDLPGAMRAAVSRVQAALGALPATVGTVAKAIEQRLANAWQATGATAAWQRITGAANSALATITGRVRSFGSAVQSGLTAPFRAFTAWMQGNMPATWGQLSLGFQIVRTQALQAAGGVRAAFASVTSWASSAIPAAFQAAMQRAGQAFNVATSAARTLGGVIGSTAIGAINRTAQAGVAMGSRLASACQRAGSAAMAAIGQTAAGINGLIGLVNRLGSVMTSPLSALQRFAFSFKGIMAGLGAGLGLGAIGKWTAEVTADAEKARVAFATMLGGSEEKAKSLLGQLQALSDTTPLELPEVRDAAKTLLAMGTSADDVAKNLRMIGDVATGVNVPIGHIAQIWGKVSLSNKVQGEELRQLSENGIPIVAELAKKYGTTTEQVYALGEQGKITFADLQQTFANLTGEGGRFNGMMAKIGQTMGGRFSTLKDSIRAVAVQLGTAMAPAFKRALDWGINFVDGLKGRMGSLQESMARLAEKVSNGIVAVGEAFNWVAPIGKQLIDTTLAGFSALGEMAATVAKSIGDVFGLELGNVQTSITDALKGVQFAFENWRTMFAIAGERIAIFGHNAWAHIKAFATNAATAVVVLAEEWRAAIDIMLGVLEGFGKNVRSLFTAITDWMMGGDFDWQKTPLLQGADAAIERLRQKFQQALITPDTINSTPTLDALQKQLNDAAEAFDRMKRERQRNADAINMAAAQQKANAPAGAAAEGAQANMAHAAKGEKKKSESTFMGLEDYARSIQKWAHSKSERTAEDLLNEAKKQTKLMQAADQRDKAKERQLPPIAVWGPP